MNEYSCIKTYGKFIIYDKHDLYYSCLLGDLCLLFLTILVTVILDRIKKICMYGIQELFLAM